MQTVYWSSKYFSQLSLNELYDLLKLRIDVFVVEQSCFYPDLDSLKGSLDRHSETIHLMGTINDEIVAYARILSPGQSYAQYASIGRVAVAQKARGLGLGHDLISKAITLCLEHFPDTDIKISAQQHLADYYQQHGFVTVSDMYLEDDIPHIAMLKSVTA